MIQFYMINQDLLLQVIKFLGKHHTYDDVNQMITSLRGLHPCTTATPTEGQEIKNATSS